MFVVKLFNRFMNAAMKIHLETSKHIIWYLKRTQDYGMFYEMGDTTVVQGFIDFN